MSEVVSKAGKAEDVQVLWGNQMSTWRWRYQCRKYAALCVCVCSYVVIVFASHRSVRWLRVCFAAIIRWFVPRRPVTSCESRLGIEGLCCRGRGRLRMPRVMS